MLALLLSFAMTASMASSWNALAAQGDATAILNLRTEDQTNPIGIDDTAPTFSWQMKSSELGQKQTAYRVVVATDSELTDVVWDSDRQLDSRSVGIQYQGPPLDPSTVYYWGVTVWNKDGDVVSSDIAQFETGLLGMEGWNRSQWIQVGTSTEPPEEVLPLNYAIDLDFQVETGGIAVVFEAQDKSNYLMWQFSVSGDELHFRPHTKKNGGYGVVKDVNVTASADQGALGQQHLRIEVAGQEVKTYLNGRHIDTTPSSSLNGLGFGTQRGRVGFRSTDSGKEAGYLDNLVITDYAADEGGLVTAAYNFDDGKNPFDAGEIKDGRFYTNWTGSSDITGLEPSQQSPDVQDVHYVVEADVTCQQDAVSILFNAADPSNFYMWQLNTADRKGSVLLKPHTWKGGAYATYGGHTRNVTAAVGGVEAFQSTPVHLKLDVTQDEIKTYLNGTLVDTFAIGERSDQGTTGIPVQTGYLGFRSSANEEGRVDNFALTDYTDNSEGEVLYSYTFDDENDNPFLAGTIENGAFVVKGIDILLPPIGVPTFRREFIPRQEVVSARLYTTGRGVYEAFLNGERVGQPQPDGRVVYDELKPGFTSPNQRASYYSYDVTPMIKQNAANAISATVTSGWWSDAVAWNTGKTSAFRAQLLLTYADGSSQVIGTDRDWKTTLTGPVIKADIYQGEVYDARCDTSYRESDYDDSGWTYAELHTEFRGVISAQQGPAVRVRDDLERSTKSVTVYNGATGATDSQYGKINVTGRYQDGEAFVLQPDEKAVFDLGQNFAGWEELELEGAAGTTVTMRHAEMLNDNDGLKSRGNDGPEGSIYTENLRTASAKGVYVMSGNGVERYHSSYTFYGFRYVEVSATQPVTIHRVKGLVVTSVQRDTGSFETSNQDVNQLFSNALWGQYSNYLSVPTDCPQRDEREGWTADTQVFSTAACYNADSKGFLEKWMQDMRDCQGSNGAYPDTAPGGGYMGQLGWADAGIIVPYNVYKMYGDKGIIEDNYASMQRYIDDFLGSTNKKGGGTAYGDWLAYESNDDQLKGLLGVAYYAWDAQMMAEMAQVMNRPEDVEKYRQVYETEKEYFQQQYVNSDGSLKIDKQTACLMALKMDLLPDEQSRETVKQMLLDNIARNGDKLQTGFLGTSVIMQTLSDIGASDVAYQLLLQRGNPSWLYSVDQGATTIWERWNSYTKESGFGDNGMNSFNHYAYGAVAEWMYGYAAGILYEFDTPGFQHFTLKPMPDQVLGFVNCSFDSPYGMIQSNWRYDNGSFFYEAEVPANTTATISVPVEEGRELTVNGKAVEELTQQDDGLVYTGTANGRATFEAAAGSYRFATTVTQYCYVTLSDAAGGVAGLVRVNGGDPQPMGKTVKLPVGEALTLEAVPYNDVDYAFSSWTGDVSSTDKTLTVVPQGDMRITANYRWIGRDSLAQGCELSSNAEWAVSDWALPHLVDGILTSEPGSLGFTSHYTSTPDVDYWIELDLGENKDFNRIQLYPRTDLLTAQGETASFPTSFDIQVRRDGETEYTELGRWEDYQAPLRKPAVLSWEQNCNARYVRLHVSKVSGMPSGEGSYYLQLAELGIYNVSSSEPVDTDKSILRAVLAYADQAKQGEEYANVIDSVRASFDAALAEAREIEGSADATQAQIDNAWMNLMREIHKLGFQKGDRAQLELLVTQAGAFDLTCYVEAGQAAFLDRLSAAQAVLADGDALQNEVDTAAGQLLDAMLALRLKADKTLLNRALDRANAVDLTLYSTESLEAFHAAKAEAEQLAADIGLTQEDQPAIDRAADNLHREIDVLTVATAAVTGDAAVQSGSSSPRTGETTPAAAVLLLLAGVFCLKQRKRR
ncbi:Alpha-L-rhamnosidase N-terminal domain protein [[Clostridium] methylpentosum DSM 5476]|uniref:alpha-L-rhamnosidase n=1 Tax=[Clostridium] methylpentosum DSM 5476 TaxID=537013 RepID=C0EAJ3_9FIRM|nr:Alpha-L-rhamnosidase N-terminal domain protein [[Clostridium] methylpentosum DSM 5476]